MIDNPKQTVGLLAKLEAALPMPAIVTPRLTATLRQQSLGVSIPKTCQVTWVSNAGDAGGIMCKLSAEGQPDNRLALVTSITQLDSIADYRWHARSPHIKNTG